MNTRIILRRGSQLVTILTLPYITIAVKLEKCRATSFANTFVPMTSRNWNSLSASIFPNTYNLQTFNQNSGAQTPAPPPSHLINFPFSSVMQGSFDCIKKKKIYIYISSHYYFSIQGMVKNCNHAGKKWSFLLLFFEISQKRLKLF